jgi:hypothetical protein
MHKYPDAKARIGLLGSRSAHAALPHRDSLYAPDSTTKYEIAPKTASRRIAPVRPKAGGQKPDSSRDAYLSTGLLSLSGSLGGGNRWCQLPRPFPGGPGGSVI